MFAVIMVVFYVGVSLLSVIIFLLSLLLCLEYLAFNLGSTRNQNGELASLESFDQRIFKVLVLVPAHNEESCIESTLISIQDSLCHRMR